MLLASRRLHSTLLVSFFVFVYLILVLMCDDGGEVSVDELRSSDTLLSEEAPVLLLLHTITGKAEDCTEFALFCQNRGWRPVVLSRRGHFGRLKSPRFKIMGDVEGELRGWFYIDVTHILQP